MAKKKKLGKEAAKLDNFNTGLDAILNQYDIIPKKEKTKIIKGLNKEKKRIVKHWIKTQDGRDEFKIKTIDVKINTLKGQTDRIPITYGLFKFHIKKDYLARIKNKEQYLDGLFHRKMKRVFEKSKVPTNEHEAKELQSLITLYDKKINTSKFYDSELTFKQVDKLTKYRNENLNIYNYSDYIQSKIDGTEDVEKEEIYKAIQSPLLLDGKLIGINFNFF